MRINISNNPKGRFLQTLVLLALIVPAGLPPGAYAQEKTAAPPADAEEVTRWLKANAVPLKGVQAGAAFDDLQPLKKVLKDVKVVGLGEATHGSREFFQFKHRMLEFLVKEMGFTVFALESSYAGCLPINDYVLYGKGDKVKALAGQGFWTWETQEVMDLIDWMREYNKDLPEAKRVKFLGYDMQTYEDAYGRVYLYLKRVAPEYLEKAGAEFPPASASIQDVVKKSDEEKKQFRARIDTVIQYMVANKERLGKVSSPREFEETLQCARTMGQYAQAFAMLSSDYQDPEKRARGGRDYYMAKNTEYIMNSEGPNTKIVSWAHNAHVALDGMSKHGEWSMGRHLRQTYGDSYYAMGFAFNQGGFQTWNMDYADTANRGVVEFVLGPAGEGTIDWYMARPGIKNYVVDFRSSNKPPQVTQWLATSLRMRSIGSGYNKKTPDDPTFWTTFALKEQFDGMIFIDTVTRARPMAKGAR